MEGAIVLESATVDQNRKLSAIFGRESRRLLAFIRKRVADEDDAQDILQEAFFELVTAYRLTSPIEQVVPWLFRVARNRIIDRFRKDSSHPKGEPPGAAGDDGAMRWEDLLPSKDAGPEEAWARRVLIEELDAAIVELPEKQREIFVAQEIEGKTFRELSEETGVSINTLLARKRSAVRHLRRRLRAIYDEFDQRQEEDER